MLAKVIDIRRGLLKRIHVNQHVIHANRKYDENNPPLTIKTYKENIRANEAVLYDDEGQEVARVVYRPDDPLSCGAHVWIETRCRIEPI